MGVTFDKIQGQPFLHTHEASDITGLTGGQTLYEAIVAPSGGDYTTLHAALADGARRIFVRAGTYDETSNGSLTIGTSSAYIVGEGASVVTILRSQRYLFSNIEVQISHVGFSNSANTTPTIELTSVVNADISNCKFVRSGSSGRSILLTNGSNIKISSNHFDNQSTSRGIEIAGPDRVTISGNTFLSNASNATHILGTNNSDTVTVIGNTMRLGGQFVSITGGTNWSISGNSCDFGSGSASFAGIRIAISTAQTSITGNSLVCTGEEKMIDVNSGASDVVIVGNYAKNNTSASFTPTIQIQGTLVTCVGNVVFNDANNGESIAFTAENRFNTIYGNVTREGFQYHERNVVRLKNTSGSTRSAGEVVILDTNDTNLSSFTTTTTAGDNLVYGIVLESTTNNNGGNVQTYGRNMVNLKVDGTTDIAVGDYLATFTTAGIAYKASAGDTAFAIALEAYTTDDSNGLIDALIISPRVV